MNTVPTKEQCISEVFDELRRAEALHPGWPSDVFRQLAIVGEEFGEAQQAALDYTYGRGTQAQYRKEVIQLAAMALRLLLEDRGFLPESESE